MILDLHNLLEIAILLGINKYSIIYEYYKVRIPQHPKI